MQKRNRVMAALASGVLALASLPLAGGSMGIASPMPVLAASTVSTYGDVKYQVNDQGTITIISWVPGLTEVVIPAEIDGLPVTHIDDYAFAYGLIVEKVTIPDSVTTIGANAFLSCGVLKELTIPASVTTIGENAFNGCSALESLTLSEGLESIGGNAFTGCTALTSLTIPASVTQLTYKTFLGCSIVDLKVDPASESYSAVDGVLFDRDQIKLICCVENKSGVYTVPDGTAIIGEKAFFYKDVNIIYLPGTIATLEEEAFSNSGDITDIYYAGTVEEWEVMVDESQQWWILEKIRVHIQPTTSTDDPDPDPDPDTDSDPDSGNTGGDTALTYLLGDLDNDGKITIQDAYQALMAYANASAGLSDGLSQAQRLAADVDLDNSLTIQDAYQILMYYAMESAGMTPSWD